MKLARLSLVAFALLTTVAACSSSNEKGEPVDATTADLSTKKLIIAGSLDYGQTSASTAYSTGSKYVAYKFGGSAGDQVDIWVKSKNGDTVAWLLDDSGFLLATNDDAAGASPYTTDSHIKRTLPASASVTHYIAVRDYWNDPMSFKVTINGTPADPAVGCNVDADCAKVHKNCCDNLGWTAVLASKATAYHDGLNCAEHPICPALAMKTDYSAAECNHTTNRCELVQPKDISCGGFIAPSFRHDCPSGYSCLNDVGVNPDLPGHCRQFCGGIAGIACHDDINESCVDNPSDGCDPAKGGADCGGICMPVVIH